MKTYLHDLTGIQRILFLGNSDAGVKEQYFTLDKGLESLDLREMFEELPFADNVGVSIQQHFIVTVVPVATDQGKSRDDIRVESMSRRYGRGKFRQMYGAKRS